MQSVWQTARGVSLHVFCGIIQKDHQNEAIAVSRPGKPALHAGGWKWNFAQLLRVHQRGGYDEVLQNCFSYTQDGFCPIQVVGAFL